MALWQLNSTILPASLALLKPTDALLFKRDAVYLLLQQHTYATKQLFVLQQDAHARNIQLPSSVQAIDDVQWVELTLKHQQVVQCQ
ncbi:MAG TPA: sulfurtransferase complex subunit TusB [Rheinheimera sp.]|nr:sulfurtransferase complex subunit TusB [Rheinheimera sp.]